VAFAVAALPWSGWRRATVGGAVALAAAALVLAPWVVRNERVFDRFIPTRIGIGQNLWEGLGEVHNDFGAVLDDRVTAAQVRREDPSLVYGTPAYDDHLRDKGTKAIREHPGHYAEVVARRAVVTTIDQHSLSWPQGVIEPLLFLAAAATLLATWVRFRPEHAFLLAIPVATLLPYLLLHVEPRYVLPAAVAYLIWAALGADLLLERRRGRTPEMTPS
jgi:hypothetical protein